MGEPCSCTTLTIIKRFPSGLTSNGAEEPWGKAVQRGFTAPTWKLAPLASTSAAITLLSAAKKKISLPSRRQRGYWPPLVVICHFPLGATPLAPLPLRIICALSNG